jgi:hypothetical protein
MITIVRIQEKERGVREREVKKEETVSLISFGSSHTYINS